MVWLPADNSLSQHELSDTDSAIELESPRYSPEAGAEVTTVMAVLNVTKLADVLSPQPRQGADRDDCTVVAVVWVVPLAADARGFLRRLCLNSNWDRSRVSDVEKVGSEA